MNKPTEGILFLCLLAALTVLSGCGQADTGGTEETLVRPAKLVRVEASGNKESRSYPASIEAATFRQLSFQVSGLVQELAVSEGQDIKKGALIAKLDERDFKNQLDSAQSQLDNAKDEYERAVRLAKEDAIAKNVLEQRKSQFDIATAAFDSVQKALNDTVMTAPFDGVISTVSIEELARVQAGEPVVAMFGRDGMQVTVDLPASIVSRINQRTNKEAVVILDADATTRIPADFKEAGLEADPTSQTFAVKFSFQPPEDLLVLPGMSATIILSSSKIGEDESNVSVPLTSILSDGAKLYVWVFDESTSTVSKREIQKKDSVGEQVIVTEGLAEGELIIGAGASYLSEGMEVRPWSDES